MFSMAGIPPAAGFVAKYFVLWAAIRANAWLVAVVAVLTAVVGLYYYVRVVQANDAIAWSSPVWIGGHKAR